MGWSLPFKILVVCFGLILTILLLGNMYIAFLKNNLFFYLLALILIVIYYFIVYQFYLKDYNYPIHFHHWFIGYVLSFFFCFDNWWNNFTYSILYGIFIEGLVYYGPTSIFKD